MKKLTSLVLIAYCTTALFQQSLNTTYASEVTDNAVNATQVIADVESTPGKVKLGDVNNDGNINAIDFAYLRKYLLGMISEFPNEKNGLAAADVDENGSINAIDFAHMRNYLLGKGEIPPTVRPTVTPMPTTQVASEADFSFDSDTGTILKYLGSGGDVKIPSTIKGAEVKALGDNAFLECKGLTKIIIPDSVTSIGKSAFAFCKELSDISFSKSLTSVEDSLFEECESLKNITIPDSVTSIGDFAFKKCHISGDVIIPNSVTSIGKGAFYECKWLKEITIPNSVTSIGELAFAECKYLEYVTLPNGLVNIENKLFYNSNFLCEVKMPESLTRIGNEAFYGCNRGLKSITIPKNVISIGDDAFGYCRLGSVIFLGNQPENLSSSAFGTVSTDFEIVVSPNALGFGKPEPYNNELKWKWAYSSNKEYNVVISGSVFEETPIVTPTPSLTLIETPIIDNQAFEGSTELTK